MLALEFLIIILGVASIGGIIKFWYSMKDFYSQSKLRSVRLSFISVFVLWVLFMSLAILTLLGFGSLLLSYLGLIFAIILVGLVYYLQKIKGEVAKK